MPIGEAFLSAFLQVLFDRLASRELLEFATAWNIDEEVKKLAFLASEITMLLQDAEERQVNERAFNMWLDQLRDVADDAENLLDEFNTHVLSCKLEAERQTQTNTLSLFNAAKVAVFQTQISVKIKEITSRLDKISMRKTMLGFRMKARKESKGLCTTSLVDDHIYGREKDAKKMTELLLEDVEASKDGVCVISLVGLGGIGKTTLAQVVYNDKQVEEHFDLKAWTCVSGQFDLVKVTKGILESLGVSCYNIENLEPLQTSLRKKLMSNKFLLVLDNFWNENCGEWDVLQLPFRAGAKGSKIIVTTRSENVARTVGNGPVLHLQLLSDVDCWSLFAQHAFSKLNSKARPNLENVGKKIATKCQGLPLAAKALGGLLRSKVDIVEWQQILNTQVWNLPDHDCGILQVLSLSYYHLPWHLKPCFVYCAIFPKGHEFDEEELVRLWIAEGLVQLPERNMHIEDVGRQYFHDLLSRSFFQRSGTGTGNISRFKMHDLMNDLAQFAAGGRCLRLDKDSMYKNSKNVRHLSYICQRREASVKFELFSSHKSLRTFLLLNGGFGVCRKSSKVMCDLLKTFRCLRVLSLSRYAITELPDLIGNLKLLRYLDLAKTSLEGLPCSVGSLYNLQTLLLYGCRNLTQLPTNMGNLVNLRYLDIRDCNLQQLPPHMGRLRNLRTLPYFLVGKDSGCEIRELKDLSNLRGDLRILQLENVDKITDAIEANLKDKEYLNLLALEWSEGFDGILDEDVIVALQPHFNLKELSIKNYSGLKFPGWTADPSYSCLVFVSLSNCKNCTFLPPLGQLPSLKSLVIEGIDALQSLGPKFYIDGSCPIKPFQSLVTLKFSNMPIWEEWLPFSVGDFACLRELCVDNCPKFAKEIPASLANLKTLEIRNCKQLFRIPSLPEIQSLVLEECPQMILKSVVHLTSLVKLHLYKIIRLEYLPSEFFHSLTALQDFQVVNCDKLKILSSQFGSTQNVPHGLHSVKSLNTVKIINCPSLVALPEMDCSSNLRYLLINECEALRSLPDGLIKLQSLEFLEIDCCPSLLSFPNGELPLTLQHLKISFCPNLKILPPELLHKNKCLECLQISGCPLTSFPTICSGLSPSSSDSFSKLKLLVVSDCEELSSFPDGLHNFINLNKLLISNCPKLVSFSETGLPQNLTSLSVSDCKNLKALPNRLHTIISLGELIIRNCSSLESVPEGGLPPNLESLCIEGCSSLPPPSKWDLYKLRSIKNFSISNICP